MTPLISLTSITGVYLSSFHQTYQPPLSATPSLIHLALLFCPGERCSSCGSSGITQARRRKRTIIFNICQTHDSNSSPFPPTNTPHTHAHKPKESTKNGGVLLFWLFRRTEIVWLSLSFSLSYPLFFNAFFCSLHTTFACRLPKSRQWWGGK